MKMLTENLKKLGKSALTGIFASAVITLLWFALFGQKSVKVLALAIFSAAVILFVLKLVYDFLIEKLGVTKKFLADELFVLFALIAFFSTTICAFAPVMLFTPVHNQRAERSLNAYAQSGIVEELRFDTDSGTLSGWMLRSGQGSAPAVLYFGKNSEDAAGRILELLGNDRDHLVFSGYHFVFIDYPEYGNSTGAASEKSLKRMGLDAYDYLINRSDVSNVILMGYGIGSGVANYVASERQPSGLILLAPYADGYDLYNSYANVFHGPLRGLVSFKMRAVKFAEKVNVKPLLLVSNTDKVVSYESGVRLVEKYKNGCNFVTVDGIGHDDFWESQEVLDEIEKYLAR